MFRMYSFRKRLFLYFFSIFLVFTLIILTFQYLREKRYRVNQLDNTLQNITQTTWYFIKYNSLYEKNDFTCIDSLIKILPQPDVRLTIINMHGVVLYDNFVSDVTLMENHFYRPEVQESLYEEFGTSIRQSATTGEKYYYYSRHFEDYFIRVAVVYNIEVQNFLKAEHMFILFIVIIFLIFWIIFDFTTRKFSQSITKLKDFVIKIRRNEDFDTNEDFPDDELGVIGNEIIRIYDNLIKTKNSLALERKKLFNHLYVLNEGVAFFSNTKSKILTNNHFIQYLNIISNTLSASAEDFFNIPEFNPIVDFINKAVKENTLGLFENIPSKDISINKSGKFFNVKCIIFNDKSFEVIINNVTKMEKNRIIKQQMTSNISHELKTPITSIKGYLETILNDPDMDPAQQKHFIERADSQANRLTDLINDIVILNKIEETSNLFAFSKLNLNDIVYYVLEDYKNMLSAKKMKVKLLIDEEVTVFGNDSLITSVFRNLLENSINYAGEGCEIKIQLYRKDDKFYYFSLSDTGIGIPDEHLPRIFERFYRIDSGRSRKLGGTGLGLAIVKNAINLHKGEITVKNKSEGGTEFLFSLPKG